MSGFWYGVPGGTMGDEMKVGITIDFFDTLVELNEDVPCNAELELIWNSNGFDGCKTNDPRTIDYDSWRLNALKNLSELCGADPNESEELANHLLETDKMWTVRKIAGAQEFIDEFLEMKIPICVLTNWDYPIGRYLEMAGLTVKNIPIISSSDIGFRKPHIYPFRYARDKLEISPSKHIHVGDSWYADVVGAIRSGAWAVWVPKTSSTVNLPTRIVQTSSVNMRNDVLQLVNRIGTQNYET